MSPAPDRVRVSAHAKVNLFLRILAREHSGFHQIETAFLLLELADQIEIRRIDRGVELEVDGPDLGPLDDNLAVRAARAVLEATGAKFGVAISLSKKIPTRAGLGGGSSDAAATLHAVNALAGNAVPRHELNHLAAKLGSDVAFFAAGVPAALGWGRGERLLALTPPPAAPALVALPRDVAVATPDAYRWWDQSGTHEGSRGPVVLEPDSLSSWGSVGRLGANDFELPVFGKHPEIRALFERLAATRPYWVRMSGSGSAVAAAYRNARDRDDAIAALGPRTRPPFPRTRALSSRQGQPLSDARGFTSRSARSAGVTGILVSLVVVETGALHLLLIHVFPGIAYAFSISNLSLIVWLIADYRALGRETVRVDAATVTLTLGLRVRASILRSEVAQSVAPIWGRDLGAAAPPALNATKPTTPNVLLSFRTPQELTIAGVVRRRVDRIAFCVDDGAALLAALGRT